MIRALFVAAIAASAGLASAQQMIHWKPNKAHRPYTALYGEITVVAEYPDTYFCGVDWWAGHPAAGTAGINIDSRGHKGISYSVWPTDKQDNAFPRVVQTNPHIGKYSTKNDVHGAHCDADYGWQASHTYQFYLTKRVDDNGGNVVVSLYFFDEATQGWVGEGRILSPIDGKDQPLTFDGLTSQLAGHVDNNDPDRDHPRLALYRLWAGTGPGDLAMITEAGGSGTWGTMNGAFYLAMGGDLGIVREMQKNLGPDGHVEPGKKKDRLQIPAEPVPENVVRALEDLR